MPAQFVFKKLSQLGVVFGLRFSLFGIVTQNITVATCTITHNHFLGVEVVFENSVRKKRQNRSPARNTDSGTKRPLCRIPQPRYLQMTLLFYDESPTDRQHQAH